MDTDNRVFFIVSAPRSASTAVATIFNEAENCICAIEPDRESKIISRDMMDGKQVNVAKWIRSVRKRVKQGLKQAEVYGEKDVTYGPMIPWLYQEFGCRFVYLIRERKAAVDSMIRWHEEITGCLYRECKDRGQLSEQALANERANEGRDLSDYSRPRPRPGDPEYYGWPDYTLRAMTEYYYRRLTQIYHAAFMWVPEYMQYWVGVEPTLQLHVQTVRCWLGLKGLNCKQIETMLSARINSVESRRL